MKLSNIRKVLVGMLLMMICILAVPVKRGVVQAEDVRVTEQAQVQEDIAGQADGSTECAHQYSGEMMVDKEATCTQEGIQSIHCIICGESKAGSEERIPLKEHTYSEWRVVEKPTYDSEGKQEQKCVDCGHINIKSIEKLTGIWKRNNIGWWYELSDGSYFTNCRKMINGAMYVFDSRGYMRTGWVLQSSKWSYHTSSGAALIGWQWLGGKWYYLNAEGIMITGWQYVGNQWYYLNASGTMLTGWQYLGGKWYYLNGSGAMQTSWQSIGGKWYYMAESGAMTIGWQYIDNYWYYMNGSGAMLTGWQWLGGKWYYLNGSGAMQTSWQSIGGKWYYMAESGAMTIGWQYIDNYWYYMNGSGAMLTGWQWLGGKWYYLNGSGVMLTGWQSIGGSWYYFYGENDSNRGNGDGWGTMAINKVIDGWVIYESGKAFPEGQIEGKIEQIKAYVGVPYRLGGSSPSGWDCSGFTKWALNFLGVNIPRTSVLQATGGTAVDKNNMNSWKPGDILVYKSGSRVNHVALYLGDGLLMHALSAKYGTLIQDVFYYEKWDAKNYLADVRRYL